MKIEVRPGGSASQSSVQILGRVLSLVHGVFDLGAQQVVVAPAPLPWRLVQFRQTSLRTGDVKQRDRQVEAQFVCRRISGNHPGQKITGRLIQFKFQQRLATVRQDPLVGGLRTELREVHQSFMEVAICELLSGQLCSKARVLRIHLHALLQVREVARSLLGG